MRAYFLVCGDRQQTKSFICRGSRTWYVRKWSMLWSIKSSYDRAGWRSVECEWVAGWILQLGIWNQRGGTMWPKIECGKRVGTPGTWGKSILGAGTCWCQDLLEGMCLPGVRNCKVASEAGGTDGKGESRETLPPAAEGTITCQSLYGFWVS